jgi:branched-chain amino acid transport system ATP-binding protein
VCVSCIFPCICRNAVPDCPLPDPPLAGEGAVLMLTVAGLDAYYGRAHILAGISLAVAKGEVLALLGRNGAGKSTTLKSIIGLVPPAAGEITFEGTRIERLAPNRIAQLGLGWVPEDRRIFSDLTVAENLEVGHQRPRDGAPVWTPERLFTLFPNLAELRQRPGGRISGGEQQMLTIARTLMGNPRLVLLDEPSEGLAPKIVEQMAETILALKREGLAIVLSEQNLHFAGLVADRATIIEKGRIRYEATMAELVRDEAVQREYLSA